MKTQQTLPHLEEAIKGILQAVEAVEAAVAMKAEAAVAGDAVKDQVAEAEASHGQRRSPHGGTRIMS
jgi:hypothetical protein